MIRTAFCLALIATGVVARPVMDDAAFRYSESCPRATVADPESGRYRTSGIACRVADWWIYGPLIMVDDTWP